MEVDWVGDTLKVYDAASCSDIPAYIFVAVALGYGGLVGALKAMGAIEMGINEEELPELVSAWRNSNPNIVRFWWDVDRAVKKAIQEKTSTATHGVHFSCRSGMLFITLPSGRTLSYVKPRMGENKFGGESVTYEGVGGTKKWERLGVTMNTYTHLGLDDAKNEMIRMEELEQARKEIDKTEGIKPMKQSMFKVV